MLGDIGIDVDVRHSICIGYLCDGELLKCDCELTLDVKVYTRMNKLYPKHLLAPAYAGAITASPAGATVATGARSLLDA